MPPAMRSVSAGAHSRVTSSYSRTIKTQVTHYRTQTSAARQHHPPLMQFNRRAVPVLLVADLTVSFAGFFGIVTPAQVQLSEPEVTRCPVSQRQKPAW